MTPKGKAPITTNKNFWVHSSSVLLMFSNPFCDSAVEKTAAEKHLDGLGVIHKGRQGRGWGGGVAEIRTNSDIGRGVLPNNSDVRVYKKQEQKYLFSWNKVKIKKYSTKKNSKIKKILDHRNIIRYVLSFKKIC